MVETFKGIDVLVIGGGLAGAFAAIKAREAGAARVVQVDKAYAGKSGCSAFAAGVIHPFFPDEDDYDAVFKEAVEKSSYLCDQERLADHLGDFVHRVKEMDGFGVKFEKGHDGKLERQTGRGTTPVMMFHGGFQMMGAMRQAAVAAGVQVVDRVMVTDLLTRDNRVVGAVGFHTITGDFHVFLARATVMATGRTWLKGRRPGHRNLSGDGIAAAYRAGAVLNGFDLGAPNQGPALWDIGPGNNMYMGSGAILSNALGESFIERYDPVLKGRTELSILATACAIEARQGRTPLHLDMTHIAPERVQRMKRVLTLPMLMYERAGVVLGDRFVKRIEWVTEGPTCAGGLKVDRSFQTSLAGLFACGDAVSRAGPSGQNALAGAATSGGRAGGHAAEYAREAFEPREEADQVRAFSQHAFQPLQRTDGVEPDTVVLALQEALMPYDVLILRHKERLTQALRRVEELWNEQAPRLCAYDVHYLRMALEARNMTLVAMFLLKSALAREESRETLREDYPERDNRDWVRWVTLKKEGEEAKVSTEPVALERCRLKPSPERALHPLWEVVRRQGQIRIGNGQVVWV